MSDGRHSTSSLQSSGVTSAEELSEKYQKLFYEFSRIKAQHSVLKKAVIKEQTTISSLQDECKTKEQELRTSLQQLDLLTFHNQRLTKRIESLQDSSTARLSPGWLVGSAKKELEKSKATLEATNVELNRKIEENEKLHKELFEVNSLYTQHVNSLESKISDLEKKAEEHQNELTRSHLASEEALSKIRQEKRDLDNDLDQTRAELRTIRAHMERNEQKLKEGDYVSQAEVITLRDILTINLGLSHESQNDQFNALHEIDNESYELIESFRELQSNARYYLESLKEKPDSDSSDELGSKVKNSSLVWQQNLQKLAVKLASAQNRITELTAEKEKLIKVSEAESNKIKILESQISQLKEELDNQKSTYNGLTTKMKGDNNTENGVCDNEVVNGVNKISSNDVNKDNAGKRENDTNITSQENDYDDDNESFIYPNDAEKRESTELSDQPIKDTSRPTALTVVTSPITRSTTDDIDINASRNVTKSEDDAKQREALIKKNYESKINQLTEQLQMSDSKSVRLFSGLKLMKEKLVEADDGRSRAEQEKKMLQNELNQLKEKLHEERENYKRQIDTMTVWIDKQHEDIANKNRQLEELRANYD
ncbi:1711_t:CDS:10 [Scutellospora calospora]|uniref:1711_t:CDS:1 n=1 Tax=Scutellospora calospora TaxID=85575 RepID=A0ACA9JUT6_9GLOM|nr:1711_t:CDS:10 [Scutellospora calospora]